MQRKEHCLKCFKDNPKLHWIDEKPLYLCGGCAYDLKTWGNFLKAYRLEIVGQREESKEGVQGGGRGRGPYGGSGRWLRIALDPISGPKRGPWCQDTRGFSNGHFLGPNFFTRSWPCLPSERPLPPFRPRRPLCAGSTPPPPRGPWPWSSPRQSTPGTGL